MGAELSIELQEALFYVFGPILGWWLAFLLAGAILAAAIGYLSDIAADLEKS